MNLLRLLYLGALMNELKLSCFICRSGEYGDIEGEATIPDPSEPAKIGVRFSEGIVGLSPATQWTHGVIITPLLHQNDVATSFWRHNDVIIASRVH